MIRCVIMPMSSKLRSFVSSDDVEQNEREKIIRRDANTPTDTSGVMAALVTH